MTSTATSYFKSNVAPIVPVSGLVTETWILAGRRSLLRDQMSIVAVPVADRAGLGAQRPEVRGVGGDPDVVAVLDLRTSRRRASRRRQLVELIAAALSTSSATCDGSLTRARRRPPGWPASGYLPTLDAEPRRAGP